MGRSGQKRLRRDPQGHIEVEEISFLKQSERTTIV